MLVRGCCKASSDKKIQHINHTIIYKKNPPEVYIALLPKDFFYDSIFKNNIFYDSIFSNDRIIKLSLYDFNLLASALDEIERQEFHLRTVVVYYMSSLCKYFSFRIAKYQSERISDFLMIQKFFIL